MNTKILSDEVELQKEHDAKQIALMSDAIEKTKPIIDGGTDVILTKGYCDRLAKAAWTALKEVK